MERQPMRPQPRPVRPRWADAGICGTTPAEGEAPAVRRRGACSLTNTMLVAIWENEALRSNSVFSVTLNERLWPLPVLQASHIENRITLPLGYRGRNLAFQPFHGNGGEGSQRKTHHSPGRLECRNVFGPTAGGHSSDFTHERSDEPRPPFVVKRVGLYMPE